jgi:hypothetical protein
LKQHGYNAEAVPIYGIDTVEEVSKAAINILDKYPNATFFGGQIVFPRKTLMSRLLHNYTLFSVHEKLYKEGVPFFVMPIELPAK